MKNNFDLKVSFSKSPTHSYEWTDCTTLMHQKVERISTDTLINILANEGKIVGKTGTLLLSDIKEAVALRLGKDGTIKARSFLDFSESLDVCEYASNLKVTSLEFAPTGEKVKYPKKSSFEKEIKDYIIKSIKNSQDEDLKKYLFYLCEGDTKDYSKTKLLESIESASIDKNLKLYKLLIEN